MTFSGVTADQKRIALPKVYARAVIMTVLDNVTDAGISAGEFFEGCVNFLRLGDQSNPLIYAERDELSFLAACAAPDGYDTTGLVTDVMPTTATDNHVQYVFYGPFDFRKCSNPAATLALRAITDEYGGATVFTATVTITLLIDDAPVNAPSYRYAREYRATSLRHEITPNPGAITALFLKGAATANYKRIACQGPSGSYYVDISTADAVNQLYCAKVALATSSAAGTLCIPCEVPNTENRKIIVENGTTQTLTAFLRQLA